MRQCFELPVIRQIDYIQIKPNLFAYKEVISCNGTILKELDGFTDAKVEDKLNKIHDLSKYVMISKEALELHRTAKDGLFGLKSAPFVFIEQPYSFISSHPDYEKTHEIVIVNTYSDDLMHLDEETYYPKAIHMDYINGGLSNEYFDLKKVLETLKNRDDVVFEKDGIVDIPYYNREPNCTEYLSILFKPSKEFYATLRKEHGSINYSKVYEELGIDQYLKEQKDN